MQFIVLGQGDYICLIGSVTGQTTDGSADPVVFPAMSFLKLVTPMVDVQPGAFVPEGADTAYIDEESIALVFTNGAEMGVFETLRALVEGGVNTSSER